MAVKFSYSFYYPYQIIKTYIRIKGGDEALVTYYENVDDPDNDFGAEYYQGKNYIIGTENPSYSRNFKQFKGLPRGLQYIIDELQKEHKNFDWESIKGKSLGESQNQYPTLEDFLNEAKKKPTTKKGKSKKFEKVMHEFGKGKLKPFHADKPLKSKKQDGTEAERTQALSIAFSESGLSKKKKGKKKKFVRESLNEEVESHPADDLKSNFRDWELYGHENDGEELFNILLRRHPDFDEDELRQMSYDWVGQEMDKELDESLNEKLETFDLDLSN